MTRNSYAILNSGVSIIIIIIIIINFLIYSFRLYCRILIWKKVEPSS